MASPRSLLRAVAAEAPLVAQSKRNRSVGTASDGASSRPSEGAQPAPRRGTPKSLIKELASGRFTDVPVAPPSPIPAAAPVHAVSHPKEILRDATVATPLSKRKLSLVQLTQGAPSSPETARGTTPTSLVKRKESMGSNASLASPSLAGELSTPGLAKRSRASNASPAVPAAILPVESASLPLDSQRLSVASLLGDMVSPHVVDAPPRHGRKVYVPSLHVDAPLPFELPPTSARHIPHRTPKAKPHGGPQVGGAKNRPSADVKVPGALMRKLVSAHTTLRIDSDAFKSIDEASELFMEQLCGDLAAYAKHRKTKTLDKSDFECLLQRQTHGRSKTSLDDLLRRNLPAEYVDEVLPVAKAGNVLVPNAM